MHWILKSLGLGDHTASDLFPNTPEFFVSLFPPEIDIGIPDEIGRLEILRIHTKNMKLVWTAANPKSFSCRV